MKTIVLVEDDFSIQEAMRFIFPAPTYCLIVHKNAEKVLSDKLIVPDVYLIDKQLSGFDGLDLCRILKSHAQTQNVPIIILSAFPNIKGLAEEAGADYTIEKPFRVSHLLKTVLQLFN